MSLYFHIVQIYVPQSSEQNHAGSILTSLLLDRQDSPHQDATVVAQGQKCLLQMMDS